MMKGKASFLISWLLNILENGQDWDSDQMLSLYSHFASKNNNKSTMAQENMELFFTEQSQKEIIDERNNESYKMTDKE